MEIIKTVSAIELQDYISYENEVLNQVRFYNKWEELEELLNEEFQEPVEPMEIEYFLNSEERTILRALDIPVTPIYRLCRLYRRKIIFETEASQANKRPMIEGLLHAIDRIGVTTQIVYCDMDYEFYKEVTGEEQC